MQLPAFSRRSAERFARLVDEHPARRLPDHHDDVAALAVVNRLERLSPGVQPDPDFKAGLRAMLMATIEREGIGVTAAAPAPGRSSPCKRAIVLVGMAATTVVLPIASVAASSGSVPGDPLYDVKRSAEQAELSLSASKAGRGQMLLHFARARAGEADAIAGDTPEMATILDQMDAQTREGVALLAQAAVDRRDPAPLDQIDAFQAEQHHTMDEVLTDITGGARTRAVTSVRLLDDVRSRVDGLRTYISCGAAAPVQSDQLGPKPRQCDGSPAPSMKPSSDVQPLPSTSPSAQPTPPAAAVVTVPTTPTTPAAAALVTVPTPAAVAVAPPTTVASTPEPPDPPAVADLVDDLLVPADTTE